MSKRSRANKSTFPGRYTGELATPIYEPVAGGVGGLGVSKAEVERRTVEKRILKMEKLFDWYSIDPDEPDAGMYLAARLALAHVPGMQVRHELRKRGRKPSWKDGLGIELVRDVAALQQTKKMNYEQAIQELRKNKKKPWRNYSLPNLITRHREARKVEQRRRRFAEQFKASPISQAMGTVFGVGLTDENSRALSIPEFCEAHGISEGFFYKLKKQGKGPREMKVGARTLITFESAAEWRRTRENQHGSPPQLPDP